MTLTELAASFPSVALYNSLWVNPDYAEYGQSLWEAKAKLAHTALLEVGAVLENNITFS